jgi:branched-chain amino acid transport system permease protein
MIAQDQFSEIEPVYWYFWIGLLMVAVVVFARGGVLGLIERLRA